MGFDQGCVVAEATTTTSTSASLFGDLRRPDIWVPPIALAVVLIATSIPSYLLFHTLAELLAVIVAIMLSAVAWQTYRFTRNDFLMYLGCGYLWVAVIDLAHAFVFKGMHVLPVESANPATQLWIAGRYLDTALLVSAFLFVGRSVNRGLAFTVFGVIAVVILASVALGSFPQAYIDGVGLTPFKIVSEYIIVGVLAAGLAILGIMRERFGPAVFTPMMLSIVFTIGAELSFTFYVGVYDLSNLVGHLFKIFAYWMIFVAIVRTTLLEPYDRLEAEAALHRATARALEVSEKRLTRIVNSIDDVFWIATPGFGEFRYVSPGCEKVWGRSAESFYRSAAAFTDAVHPEDRSRVTAGSEQTSNRREYRLIRSDGSVRWMEDKIVRVGDGGNSDHVVGISRDITERKQAEMTLARLNRCLRLIHFVNRTMVRAIAEDELIHGVCRNLVEEGCFRLAWVAFFDDAENSLQPVAHFGVHGADIAHLVPGWHGNLADLRPIATPLRKGKPLVLDVRGDAVFSPWRTAAERRGFVSVAMVPLRRAGEPFGLVGVYTSEPELFDAELVGLLVELADDLAFGIMSQRERVARIAAEVERGRESERAAKYLSIAGTMIVAWEPTGRVTLLNRKGTEILGCAESEAIGTDWFETFVPEDQRGEAAAVFQNVVKGRSDGSHFESEVVGRDGQRHLIAWNVTAVRDDAGDVVGALGSGEDITVWRETEHQLMHAQKVESLGNLAAGIAHDFNNLLLPIMALAGMVAESLPKGSDERGNLETVLEASHRAKELVHKILVFCREEEPKLRVVDLCAVVDELVPLMRSTIPATIELRPVIRSDVGHVMADPAQIHSVLMNLVANAVYAMNGRAGHLDVQLERVGDDESHEPQARIVVRDDGEGIEPDTLKRIFDPYFSTKPVGEGTGLGLAMAYSIITKHGGTIAVESTVGKGTMFEIMLPIVEAQQAGNGHATESAVAGES